MDGIIPLLFVIIIASMSIGTITSVALAIIAINRRFKSPIPLWIASGNCIQIIIVCLVAYTARNTGIGLMPFSIFIAVLIVSIFSASFVSKKSDLDSGHET
jgi:hypothetical protein